MYAAVLNFVLMLFKFASTNSRDDSINVTQTKKKTLNLELE